MSAVYGNDIYIFGGVVNGISQNIYKFNIINHSFEELDLKLLEPRAGGRAIVDDYFNNIYIIGGYNEASTALNSVEIFYPDSYIEQGSPIQEARYYFMSENWNGTPYILGGFNENGEVVKSIERLGAWATDIDDSEADNTISYAFELFQNYPNPFNPETTINYSVPSSEIASMARQSYDITSVNSLPHNYNVILKIYDVMGCEVKTLVNEPMQPGNYSISFDASHLSSGVYYYQLKISDFIQTKKMVLMK
jgi:hypothetical protein